ncbi:unnamed protein product [Chrysodeixis includens]|uniref:Uncharacterized protein n=1 Tax=Chrysodeixis includens TaxID=689277 RepID=A0A9N8PYX4_CHRIL|nr:unnamed protein product [Chrysodeixis includens]
MPEKVVIRSWNNFSTTQVHYVVIFCLSYGKTVGTQRVKLSHAIPLASTGIGIKSSCHSITICQIVPIHNFKRIFCTYSYFFYFIPSNYVPIYIFKPITLNQKYFIV